MRALWVYKCNINDPISGKWEDFFDHWGGAGRWGGTRCIESPASRKILREEMQVGDLVLAWQTDRRVAVGLCRVTELRHDDGEIDLYLETVQRFPEPVKLLEWKKRSPALANGRGFLPAKQGTLFDTTTEEAHEILRISGLSPAVFE